MIGLMPTSIAWFQLQEIMLIIYGVALSVKNSKAQAIRPTVTEATGCLIKQPFTLGSSKSPSSREQAVQKGVRLSLVVFVSGTSRSVMN